MSSGRCNDRCTRTSQRRTRSRAIVFFMADSEHVVKLREGPNSWNRWREEHAGVYPRLNEAYLCEAYLRAGKDLVRAVLKPEKRARKNSVAREIKRSVP